MQLIVETETALDIERTMSTVEEIQSTIVDNVDIDDLNDKKCNGNNKIKDVISETKNEEDKQVCKENEEALTKTPMDVDGNEAELSNVDLSEVISKQNSLEANAVQIDESQEDNLVNDTNGIDDSEKEIVNQPEETPEEDYLEDDIISIRPEPYEMISEPITEYENKVTNDDQTAVNEESQVQINDKTELVCETEESQGKKEDNAILDEEKDIIELIEEESEDLSNHFEKVTEPIAHDGKSESETIQKLNDSPIPCDIEKEKSSENEKDNTEFTETTESSTIDIASKEESEPLIQDDDDKNATEVIEESNNASVVKETETVSPLAEDKDNLEVDAETEPSLSCKTNSSLSVEDSKNLEETNKSESDIKEKSTSDTCKDNMNDSIDECEGEENAVTDKISTNTTENNLSIVETEEIEKKEDATKEITCDNKEEKVTEENKNTNATSDETAEIKVMETVETNKDDTVNAIAASKNEPAAENTKTDDSTSVPRDMAMEVEETVDEPKITSVNSSMELSNDMDVEEAVENTEPNKTIVPEVQAASEVHNVSVNTVVDKPIICKLSNTLDILSDDDEEEPSKETSKAVSPVTESPKANLPNITDTKEKQCINIEDDDDIMLIDEDTNKTVANKPAATTNDEQIPITKPDVNTNSETGEQIVENTICRNKDITKDKAPSPVAELKDSNIDINIKEKTPESTISKPVSPAPLVPENFLKTAKKKLADMTRDEIEEFCILKIVESIVDRSSLSDIKNKLRSMTQGLEEYRKKAMMLTKQNRDLQVVLKSVQEEQKKATGDTPITPLKITRSVGMQVFMEKTVPRKKGPQNANNKPMNNTPNRNVVSQAPRQQKPGNQQIPVPRLVPANNPALKTPSTIPQINQINAPNKNTNPPNGLIKNPSPATKAEKRQHSKMASSSVTVDLTDDEPPAKMPGGPKTSPAPPVRIVNPQNLMAPQRQAFGPGVNSPRKVYIPISGPQNQPLRPGQTIMLKTVPAQGIRPRLPAPNTQVTRMEPNAVRMNRILARHPAPLPSGMKQYQPPNWKGLPPAPDLKLSKVENGIVISWKIEGVPEDTYEEIASYQLYAYQETSTPPSTALWKKIGDVKALPLPMACTLTQFMAGFKYYFAVRAVDVRSRLGPFSLPGSILLLSKNI